MNYRLINLPAQHLVLVSFWQIISWFGQLKVCGRKWFTGGERFYWNDVLWTSGDKENYIKVKCIKILKNLSDPYLPVSPRCCWGP